MYQGCRMAFFQTKNPTLGKFWRALQWKMLVYFMDIWSILRPFDILYGRLVYFVVIWYIFPRVGKLKNLATLHITRTWLKRNESQRPSLFVFQIN
jgi:hypothetical protein